MNDELTAKWLLHNSIIDYVCVCDSVWTFQSDVDWIMYDTQSAHGR